MVESLAGFASRRVRVERQRGHPIAPSRDAALVLWCTPGVGAAGFRRAVAAHGDPSDAVAALSAADRSVAEDRASRVRLRCEEHGILILQQEDDAYPQRVAQLEDAPPVLFVRGRAELLGRPSVGIVGTREATPYGVRITERLARAASEAGVTIVSGLARGIDAAAHRAAVNASGSTVAVLGTGVDVAYPEENHQLYRAVVQHGVVVSESLPGSRAHRGAFPKRNRIIAALSDVLIVTEAGHRSGALISAAAAAALGRSVAAVPGPVDVPSSAGSNALLRDGAQTVTCIDDVFGLLRLAHPAAPSDWLARHSLETSTLPAAVAHAGEGNAAQDSLSTAAESRVLSVLRAGPRRPDELLHVCGVSPSTIASTLAGLELAGVTSTGPDGLVRLC